MRSPLALLAVLAFLLLGAAPAAADVQQLTYRVGPIEVDPYQVKQSDIAPESFGIPKPDVDGFVTAMEVDLVDADGSPVPIQRLMLHHIVFANLGATLGDKQDATCSTFTGLDSKTVLPGIVERFYAAGEERAKLRMPPNHGYQVDGKDIWGLTYMVMNHRASRDKAYIQYKITYDTSATVTPARPAWLDVRNCLADPVYDVPGGGRAGSDHKVTSDWTVPSDGRVIAGGGHVHGGGKALQLSQPDCADRVLLDSRPTWGERSHPFYNVKPVLHEPGPVSMSSFASETGFPVTAGQKLRLNSIYDAERPHTRVMGIMVVFLAPPAQGKPAEACAPAPTDVAYSDVATPERSLPPRVTVPLTGFNANGRAVTIKKPPGKLRRGTRRTKVAVKKFSFSKRNILLRKGSTIDWTFADGELHDVTLASGPRGFSSPHLNDGRKFSQRFTVPGTYKLFCSLHPVAMTERIVVRR